MKKAVSLILILLLSTIALGDEHIVEYGESLWKIAKQHYGDGEKWPIIYQANLKRIKNPHHIRPGWELVIPDPKTVKKVEDVVPEGYEYWKTVRCKLTGYEPSARCCAPYADGKTSIGDNAWHMDGVAAHPEAIPYRTMLYIPEFGFKEVDDTGPAMRKSWKKGIYHVDVRFTYHYQARKLRKWTTVKLYRKARPRIAAR